MLIPSIYARDLFDDVFEPFYRQNKTAFNANGLMKTDVKETDEGYDLSIDLPGVSKDDIKAEVHRLRKEMEGKPFILGADCTLATNVDRKRINAAVDAARDII